jgi:CDP-diacylglycerol--serine O-phosphatidyltransferase
MDLLCDIVSFGVVPTFIAYTFLPGMWKIISFLIIITGVYRLARYNTTDQSKIFMGIPITFTALVFSILLITGFVDQYLIAVLSVILSLGMASKIKIKRI